jgi:WD40 repeat protein
VGFNANGTILITSSNDGMVRLWNLVTGKEVGASIRADIMRFGGRTVLATGTADRTVRLRSLATGREIGTPIHVADFDVAAVNADGTILASDADPATAGLGATFVLSNPETGRKLGMPITADASGYVSAMAFNPSGTILATGDSNGMVQLWTMALWINPYRTLCAEAGPPSRRTWSRFAPGEPMPSIC